MSFKKNFETLCVLKGCSLGYACTAIGLSDGAHSKWTDNTKPRAKTLYKAAEFFGVKPDYLLVDTDQWIEYNGKFIPAQSEKTVSAPDPAPVTPANTAFTNPYFVRLVPVYNSVSAGFGAEAVNSVVDYTPLFIRSEEQYHNTLCINVIGDSMYPLIANGDMVQVLKQDTIVSGDIGVVLVGNDGYVKRIVYTNNYIELQSINTIYPPMKFTGADMREVRIVGKVQKIIHSL